LNAIVDIGVELLMAADERVVEEIGVELLIADERTVDTGLMLAEV
jgi:hypothetical protein